MISRKRFIHSQGMGFEVDFLLFFSVNLKIILGLGKC